MSNPNAIYQQILRAEEVRLEPPADLDAEDCSECNGTGEVLNADFPLDRFDCQRCDGSGLAPVAPPCRCRGERCRC